MLKVLQNCEWLWDFSGGGSNWGFPPLPPLRDRLRLVGLAMTAAALGALAALVLTSPGCLGVYPTPAPATGERFPYHGPPMVGTNLLMEPTWND